MIVYRIYAASDRPRSRSETTYILSIFNAMKLAVTFYFIIFFTLYIKKVCSAVSAIR